jgi:hypothetical protein
LNILLINIKSPCKYSLFNFLTPEGMIMSVSERVLKKIFRYTIETSGNKWDDTTRGTWCLNMSPIIAKISKRRPLLFGEI